MLEHAIWWQTYPLRACGAPDQGGGDVEHRLPRLERWLDYVVELGCNGLLLGPIFESSTHGYDTLDHFRIDPRLGDDADFDHLMAACQQRGLSIVLDGVFNHVSRDHSFVTERPELIRTVDGQPQGWEGHDILIELDHSSSQVQDLVVDVMLHWLRRGIAGWRLDVAYAVPPEFWSAVTTRVRQEFPDALFLGEVIHGDYPQFVADSDLTTVTQYELWKGIWSSLKDGNPWEMAHALERHAEFCQSFIPQTFVGNHDVTRIASQVGAEGARLAVGMLMTLPGAPSIYYGDEQGFTGIKREEFGGDDDIRPALPDDPSRLSNLGADMLRWHKDLIGFRRRHAWLATGQIEVTHKDDAALDFAVTGAGRVDVHVDYSAARIAIVSDGEELHAG